MTMKRKKFTMKTLSNSTSWLGLALACGILTFAVITQAAKSPKPPPAPVGPTYKIVGLGTLSASRINESGWVTANAYGNACLVVPVTSPSGPVYYRDTTPTDGINDLIIPLPGLDPSFRADAGDLNDAGLIVGQSVLAGTNRSTLWLAGLPINLAETWWWEGSAAYAINNRGLIVTADWEGDAYVIVPEDTDGDGVADNWVRHRDSDGINELRKLVAPFYFVGTSGWWINFEPRAMNDAGQIILNNAGSSLRRCFRLTPDAADADRDGNPWYADANADGINDLMVELATLTTRVSNRAYDINASGQVVGESGGRAVRWDFNGSAQTVTDLGVLSATVNSMAACAINDAGQIVGGASFKNGSSAGFLFYKGTMYDLATRLTNGSGWSDLQPTDINNQGFIVGMGSFNGVTQGFVAVPVTQP
jgi:probable HAF family extracellular repeat protein